MKKFKCMVALLLIGAIILANAAIVGASDIMPIYDNCFQCITAFNIIDGVGYLSINYYTQENFSDFTASVTVQKRVLGIFWDTIEIAENTEAWIIYSTRTDNSLDYSFPLTKKGTYRAVFDIKFYGEDGSVDDLGHTIQKVYE